MNLIFSLLALFISPISYGESKISVIESPLMRESASTNGLLSDTENNLLSPTSMLSVKGGWFLSFDPSASSGSLSLEYTKYFPDEKLKLLISAGVLILHGTIGEVVSSIWNPFSDTNIVYFPEFETGFGYDFQPVTLSVVFGFPKTALSLSWMFSNKMHVELEFGAVLPFFLDSFFPVLGLSVSYPLVKW